MLKTRRAEQRQQQDEARERHRAERERFYAGYDDPDFAGFVGELHICQTCFAVAADMPRHIDWHRSISN